MNFKCLCSNAWHTGFYYAMLKMCCLCQDERLLIVLNNCRYARNNVLPKLVDSFRNNDYPITDKLKKVTSFFYYIRCTVTIPDSYSNSKLCYLVISYSILWLISLFYWWQFFPELNCFFFVVIFHLVRCNSLFSGSYQWVVWFGRKNLWCIYWTKSRATAGICGAWADNGWL